MSDESKKLPAVAEEKSPTKASKKAPGRFSLSLERALKKNKFSPVSYWINNILPHLDPKDASDAVIKLLPYLYPTYRALDVTPTKPQKVTNAIQINVPGGPNAGGVTPPSSQNPLITGGSPESPAPLSLEDLYAIAAGNRRGNDPE